MDIELIEKPETALSVQDRAALALNASQTEQDLIALAAKNASIVAIIDNPGRAQAHGAAMELKRARTDIEKVSKAAREDATKFSKAVISEEKRLIAIIEPEEIRILALRDGWDAEQDRIKEEKAAAERARVTAITDRIAGIRQYVELAASCRTAARVQELIGKLDAMLIEWYEEFEPEATEALESTKNRVIAIHAQKFADEAERDRIKAEQAEATVKLAQERAEFEAQQAAAKIEADRLAALAKAEADRVAAMQAAQAAKAKAEADAAAADLAIQKAAFEKEAAEARAIVAAHKAQVEREIAAEQAKQVAEQAAITQAAIDQARQAKSMPVELLDEISATVAFIASPACCAPDGVCTDACSNANPAEPATDPSDADIVWIASRAVANEFNLTQAQAAARLQLVSDWIIS